MTPPLTAPLLPPPPQRIPGGVEQLQGLPGPRGPERFGHPLRRHERAEELLRGHGGGDTGAAGLADKEDVRRESRKRPAGPGVGIACVVGTGAGLWPGPEGAVEPREVRVQGMRKTSGGEPGSRRRSPGPPLCFPAKPCIYTQSSDRMNVTPWRGPSPVLAAGWVGRGPKQGKAPLAL